MSPRDPIQGQSGVAPQDQVAGFNGHHLGEPCPNCGERGRGPYCSACGERFLTDHDLSLKYFVLRSLPHELFDIDGKFVRTMRVLVFRPGALASDYVAGRRKGYLEPLRFYVIAFLLHATLTALFAGHGPSLLEQIHRNDPWNLLTRLAASRRDINWSAPELRESLSERTRWGSEIGTMLVFLGVAAIQRVVFFRTHRRYLEHVALALNVVSFYIVVMVLIEAALGIFAGSHYASYDADAQTLTALTLLPLYWFLAIRRFYGVRALPALFGTGMMWIGNVLIAQCINVLVLAILIESA
jgi:hypothetical protein